MTNVIVQPGIRLFVGGHAGTVQGERKDMRITLCGYDFEMPEGWTIVRWKAAGGYGGQGNGRGRENSTREMIAFSPHCLDLDGLPMFAYLRDQEAA